MSSTAETSGTESATRVASLLLLFISGSDSLGVTTIARELGLSKGVVHRILRALVAQGLLTHDPHTREYSLGPAAVALGATAMRSSDLRLAARPILQHMQSATNETVTLSSLTGNRRVYLDQIESAQEIKMTVELGRLFPLNAGSSGRVILAFLPEERREAILLSDLPRLTNTTIVDADALREDCARIRSVGYAVSQGERQSGAASIASPVFNLDGEVTGSISVCGPAHRLTAESLHGVSDLLREHAFKVSAALGYKGAADLLPPPADSSSRRSA